MKKFLSKICVATLALSLIPAAALGSTDKTGAKTTKSKKAKSHKKKNRGAKPIRLMAAAPEKAGSESSDASSNKQLSLSELTGMAFNFQVSKEGNDPNARAVVYGMMFSDCAGDISIQNTSMDSSIKKDGIVGF